MRAWIPLVSFAASAGGALAAGTVTMLAGAFALPETARSVARLAFAPQGATTAKFDFALSENAGGATIREYDRRLTKRLTIVAVSSDFSNFQTLAPTRARDGHFSFELKVPKAGVYYLYADTQPRGIGRQVFRFDVPFGAGPAPTPDPLLAAAAPTVLAGPYNVTLSSLELTAGKPALVRVHIASGLKPATDLRPYLSAAANAVLLSEKSLAYGDARAFLGGATNAAQPDSTETSTLPDNASVPADFNVMLTPPNAGLYKLWIQFKGGDRVYAAPFVLTAS